MESERKCFTDVPITWEPKAKFQDNKAKFVKLIEEKYKVSFDSYWDLHKWSVEHVAEFWAELWDYSGIIHSQKFNKVIDPNIPMSDNPEWFEGAKLNFAENLLRHRNNRVAIYTVGEDKGPAKITYTEMYEKAKLYAAAFRKFGLKKEDRVVCYMSNREEPVFAMLGAVSIGAIWTGALPLIGAQAAINRFKQVQPKVLITIDRFQHNKEEVEMLQKVKAIAEGLPSLEKVIIVPSKEASKLKDISGIPNSCFLEDFLELGYNKDGTVPEIVYEQVSITHPVFINYTSGTTGLPKPLVHGTGVLFGVLRDFCMNSEEEKIAVEQQNKRPNQPTGEDKEFVTLSLSPVGWATWVSFTTFFSVGITLVLYEGVPYFLSPTYLWDLVDQFKITVMFIPPSILDELEKRNYVPTKNHSLRSMIRLVSGGSVVKPQNYDFVHNKVKKDIMFFSGYGSTEMMGSGLSVNRSLPIHKGELTCQTLATVVECLDDSGNHVIGELGELVVSIPSPTLPLGLWGDKDGSIFKQTYFSKFPGKFTIGDIGCINPVTKGYVIHCRSDETLKQRGCRFGSSEIYNVVNAFHEVLDSLCVSQYNSKNDERAVLFLKLRNGFSFDEDLVKRIRLAIEKELTDCHVPDLILETKDIPHNMNGKKMEITVKKIINNMPYNDDTIINKECLEYFRQVPPYED